MSHVWTAYLFMSIALGAANDVLFSVYWVWHLSSCAVKRLCVAWLWLLQSDSAQMTIDMAHKKST